MDAKQILSASYLDILFEGKNKKYGGYELRKKYPRRAAAAGLIAILVVGGVFGAMLIKPKEKEDTMTNEVPIITEMQNLEPPPPIDETAPPPPPPPAAPPPVRPTVKFTVPEIKKDNEVVQEAKLSDPPKEKEDVGVKFEEGSNDINAVPQDLAGLGGERGGTGGPAGEIGGTGKPKEDEIVAVVQQQATNAGWESHLRNNLKYPNAAREAEIEGRVYVKFVVEKDGSVSNVTVTRGGNLGYGLPEEAIRVIKSSPKWKPGVQGGHPVRSYMQVPITFKLQ